MSKGIGRLFSIGIAKETTRGTAISSASWWLPFSDAAIEEKFNNVTQDEAYGIIEDSVGQFRVKNWAEGTLKVPLTSGSFPLLMYSLFGANADSAHGAEAAVYDHKATVGETAQHQSLTLFIHDPLSGVDYSHALGVVHKMDLDVELKKFAELSLSVKAIKGVSQSSFSPSITAENRFLPQYMTFNMAPTTSGLLTQYTCTGTASSTIHVTALSISTDLLQVGMTVTGTNIPAGTTIATIVSNTAFDMSQASTGAAGTLYIGSLNATGTASSTIHVTALSGITTAKLQVGMTVMGTNVPAGATIVKIVSSTAFDLSAASTGAIGTLSFGGAVVQLKSLKLSVDENVEDDEVLGNVAPVDFLNKEFKVDGSFECIWQNESDAKTFALATPVTPEALLISIVNSDVTIGTAANPTVAITLDQVYFTDFSRPIKVKDLVYQTVKFKATYSTTNTEMIKVVTTNTTASY
jgi:hypothetical protein